MEETRQVAVELRGLYKSFGTIIATKNVDLDIYRGEILSVLGENGSGKSTLMNLISGIYFPERGQIKINGKEVVIKTPKDAIDNGIGMVYQHFKLVDVFTAAENIILGMNDDGKYNLKKSIKQIREICDKYGFDLDPEKKIYEMSVSEKQTVEIVKVLFRGADILILDEPTAVLTPQEISKLFEVLRNMRKNGKTVVIITHKLNEVLSLSDRVVVMRKGEQIGTVNTAETNEAELTEMMVGKKVELEIGRTEVPDEAATRLSVEGLTIKSGSGNLAIDNVSFSVKSGEILGIAGIAGSGQKELLEAIAGLQKIQSGSIIYNNPENGKAENLKGKTPVQIRELGVRLSFVPEDRLGMGLVGNMDIIDNMMLRSYRKGKTAFLQKKKPKELAEKVIQDLEVVTPSATTPIRRLSGGNIQKILVGREIASSPTVLMAAYAVRGLDINSSYMIYNLLNEQKKNGAAVIFVGEDLDVLMDLCDRIMVLSSGSVTGIVEARNASKENLGLLMTRNTKGGNRDEQ